MHQTVVLLLALAASASAYVTPDAMPLWGARSASGQVETVRASYMATMAKQKQLESANARLTAQAALYSLNIIQLDEDAKEKQFISETKLNWKVQRDHEERFHSIDSLKQSIEDRKPDFDAYIDAQKKEKADAQTKIDHEERGHSIDSQKNSVDAQKKKKADPEKKNAIDPQKNSVDPQKKKADVIIQLLPTELGKDDKNHLKVEMIQLKRVPNFKTSYRMDMESEITIKPVDVDTRHALKNKLNTTPQTTTPAPGVTQDDSSIKWVDVVLTVLPLVCELYVVVSLYDWGVCVLITLLLEFPQT